MTHKHPIAALLLLAGSLMLPAAALAADHAPADRKSVV